MTRLVRDLLQLSNLDYQKTNWKKTRISLGEILKDIGLKLDLAFKEKKSKARYKARGRLTKYCC